MIPCEMWCDSNQSYGAPCTCGAGAAQWRNNRVIQFFRQPNVSGKWMVNNTGEWRVYDGRIIRISVDYNYSPMVYTWGNPTPVVASRADMTVKLTLDDRSEIEVAYCERHDRLAFDGMACSCYPGGKHEITRPGRYTHGYKPGSWSAGFAPMGYVSDTVTSTIKPPPPQQLTGAIRMWRMWYLTKTDEIRALNTTHVWTKGENVSHQIPQRGNDSHCGFYGFNSWEHFIDQEAKRLNQWHVGESDVEGVDGYIPHSGLPVIIGSFLGYGKCVVAKKGARVEKAVPEYLVLSPNQDYSIRLLTVAEKYGMTPISLEEVKTLKTGLVPFEKTMPKPESKGDWLL